MATGFSGDRLRSESRWAVGRRFATLAAGVRSCDGQQAYHLPTNRVDTLPSIPSTAGSWKDSATGTGATAAVLDSAAAILSVGTFLRLDLTAVQTGTPIDMILSATYKVTGALLE